MQSQDDEDVPSPPPGHYPDLSPTTSPHLDPIKANIAEAVLDRRGEYVVQKSIKIKVGTWNVASTNGTEKDVKNWFVTEQEITDYLASLKLEKHGGSKVKKRGSEEENHGESANHGSAEKEELSQPVEEAHEIGLYVLGLQEIVDISSPAHLLNPIVDPVPSQRWRHAVEEALPLGYQFVAQQQLVGLHLLVYASPLVKPIISDVASIHVATGGMGWTGNKGAVAVRIVLGGITRLLFVDSHLTAGNEKINLDRRNWDVTQILNRAKFFPVRDELDPSNKHSEKIGDEDFAFWFGDLNYRLEGIPGDDVRRLLTLHTKGEYGQDRRVPAGITDLAYGDPDTDADAASEVSDRPPLSITLVGEDDNPATPKTLLPHNESSQLSDDPTSLKSTLASLLSHDQLHTQIEQHKAFHDGWEEGDIDFLPTYKYDIGAYDIFDSSEKHRGPSWCDRILFRSKKRRRIIELQRFKGQMPEMKRQQQPSGVLFDSDPDKEDGLVTAYPPTTEAPHSSSGLYDYDPNDEDGGVPPNPPNTEISENSDIRLQNYSSHQHITSSDHKPLEALFTIRFLAEDKAKKDEIYWKVARMFDSLENENRPRVTIVSTPIAFTGNRTVNFGSIRTGQTYKNELTVANTGTTNAILDIINSNSGKETPDWLTILGPQEGKRTLTIGDVATIELHLYIKDEALGQPFGGWKEQLEHILVVRVEDGADYFVSIRATLSAFVGTT